MEDEERKHSTCKMALSPRAHCAHFSVLLLPCVLGCPSRPLAHALTSFPTLRVMPRPCLALSSREATRFAGGAEDGIRRARVGTRKQVSPALVARRPWNILALGGASGWRSGATWLDARRRKRAQGLDRTGSRAGVHVVLSFIVRSGHAFVEAPGTLSSQLLRLRNFV